MKPYTVGISIFSPSVKKTHFCQFENFIRKKAGIHQPMVIQKGSYIPVIRMGQWIRTFRIVRLCENMQKKSQILRKWALTTFGFYPFLNISNEVCTTRLIKKSLIPV